MLKMGVNRQNATTAQNLPGNGILLIEGVKPVDLGLAGYGKG